MDDPSGGYRITNEVLFEHIERLRVQVGDLSTDVKLTKQSNIDALRERDQLRVRVERLETRVNGMAVGIGTGVLVGVVYFLRGAVS